MVASLLFLLILMRSWNLLDLIQLNSKLKTLGQDFQSRVPTAELLMQIDALSHRDFSETQIKLFRHDRENILTRALDEELEVVWANGRRTPLLALTKAQLGIHDGDILSLALRPSSILEGRVRKVMVNSVELTAKENRWPLITESIAPNPKHMDIAIAVDDVVETRHYSLTVANDVVAPTLLWNVTNRGTLEPDADGNIGVKPGEALNLYVNDDTMIAKIVVHDGSGREIVRIENKAEARHAFNNLQIEGSGTHLIVAASDHAGNKTKLELGIRRWLRAAPRINSVTMGKINLLQALSRTKESSIDLVVQFAATEPNRRLLLESNDGKWQAEGDAKTQVFKNIPLRQRGLITFRFSYVESDKTTLIKTLKILRDDEKPHIGIYKIDGTPINKDTVTIATNTVLVLEVTDNDALARGGVKARPAAGASLKRRQDT